MKKLSLVVMAILLFIISNILYAQETIPEKNTKYKGLGFYVGGHASTNGLGLNLEYVLTKKISLKSGFENIDLNPSFNFNENEISYNAAMKYKTGGIYVFADYFITRGLYFSGGALINSLKPKIIGSAASDLTYGDLTIPVSKIGEFNITIEPSIKVSPYAALGLRKTLGENKRVAFNFETGFYYMGPPKFNIDATGLLAPTADPAHGKKELLEKQFESYKFYPMVKFGVAVKLF